MTIKQLLLILIVLFTLNAVSVYAQVCGGTITSNTTLAANLNCAGNGLKVNTSNIYLNCSGFNITGNQVLGTYGILLDGVTNVKVVNCNVRNFSFGLLVNQSNFSYVFNNTLDNNRPGAGGGYGIYVNYSDNGTFYRNVINKSDIDGIRIRESAGNNFTKNVLDLNDDRGIYMFRNCQKSYFIRNNISRTQFFSAMGSRNVGNDFNLIAFNRISGGTNFQQFDNNNITQNLFFDTSGSVILQTGVSNNVISKNVLRNTSGVSVGSGTNNNTIINNTAYNGKLHGFRVSAGSLLTPNRFIRNKAFNNSGSGFFGVNAFRLICTGNRFYDNNGSGFSVRSSGSVINISNNTVFNNSGYGFFLELSFPFGTEFVFNNSAYNNTLSGMYFLRSSNVSVFNNTIFGNRGCGIRLNKSNVTNITRNTVTNHTCSINLTNSSFNTIYNNYFEDIPAADALSTNNAWNITKTAGTNIIGGPFLGGNFWALYTGVDLNGDGLGDTNLPWKGLTNGIANGGDFHPLTFIYVKDIQCEFNNSGSFVSCSNATFFANITQVRVNCTSLNGIVSNATFNLTNLFDSKTFFVNTTSTVIGGYYVLDNPDVQILDSGNWTIDAVCTNTSGSSQKGTYLFNIPFGTILGSVINPPGDTTVQNGSSFNVTCRMQCTGGECVNVNVTLDPINPGTNLTQPSQPVHAVYADSVFIYGASQDQGVYVWNKTGLGLFSIINTSMPNRAVFADSSYIYAGGVGGVSGNLTIYNRTDLATPFASVVNLTPPGNVFGVKSDNNYIYAVGGVGFGPGAGPGFLSVYNKSTFASVINLTFSDIVRGIDIDNTAIYTVSHACEVNVTNISGFAPVTNLSVPAACFQAKSVSVNDDFIIATGHIAPFGPPFAWTRVYNKSDYSVVFNWNDTTRVNYGLAAEIGGADFAYYGGQYSTGGFPPATAGFLNQLNKTSLALNDSINITSWTVKGLFCDNAFLYAAAGDLNIFDGMVMLFNNSCPTGPLPPSGITVNSLVVRPAALPVPGTAHCSANVTTAGVIANVTFNVTFPDGSSILLNSTNVGGDIFNSSNFTVSSAGLHACTVFANNTNGSNATRSRNFYAGNKGTVPMNSGSPFYTTNQNPRYPANQSCLNSTIPGNNCDSSWNVSVNGTNQTTWQFFCIYESAQGVDDNTSRVNITIGQPAPPPPPPPAPSGGGGGGSATRAWQQEQQELEAECIESWFCEPWSECKYGEMTRVCVDLNACGTEKNKPPESMPCKKEVVEEPAAVIEETEIKEITKKEPKPTVVVESPGKKGLAELISSRNALRALLAAVVLGALVYVFALSKFLKKQKTMPKKARMKDEDFKPVKKPKPVKKTPAKTAPKKPEPLPDTTKGLLDELDKL
ncbi:hypothetical protein GF343_00965 [Candidatus Woesearchaeota archaeon]|nr:hypothetical protein [Candidatus Woesearchaeota archaeon]